MRLSPKILICGLLLLQGLTFAGLVLETQTPVVSLVNLKTIQAQFIRQLAERTLSDEQVNHATTLFKEKLKDALTQVANDKHAILLDSETVITGGIDCTEDVLKSLSQLMRKKS